MSTTTNTTPTSDKTPAGYRRTGGPGGIDVIIPAGWPVKRGTIASNDQADNPDGSGAFVRYGGSPAPSMSLRAAVAENETTNSGIRTGYQRIRLDNITGITNETVLWEFLFTKGGVRRHSLGWFWRVNGTDYVVYASSDDIRWPELRPVIDVMARTAGPL